MIRAFVLSIGQLADPAILKVLAVVVAITLALFALLGVALWWTATALTAAQGWGEQAGLAAGAAAVAAALVAGWLLFRIVAVAVMGLFADGVVEAVERRHYHQALAGVRHPSIALSLRMGLASALRALFFNLLALPLYLVLLVTGVGTVALFALVNALLLGRDLGEMVAVRHMDRAAVRGWLAATRVRRFALGLAVTLLFMIPVLNLLAPVLGAAMATHLFHEARIFYKGPR